MKNLILLCVMTGLCLYGEALNAQLLVLKNHDHDRAISPYAFKLKEPLSIGAIETVRNADTSRFVRNLLPHEVDYGIGTTSGWCTFRIRNDSDEENWILRIQHSRVDTAQLFIVRGNGTLERFPATGHYQRLAERSVRAISFAYAISLKKNETVTCYLYTARQYGRHAAVLNLQTKKHFESYEYGFNLAVGFVGGMVVLASFVGFFLFVFVRQRLYVFYSLYALSFFLVLMADTGVTHALLFFPIDQTVVNCFTITFYYWMGCCLGIFTIDLLQINRMTKPWLYWFGILFSLALGISAILMLIPGLPHTVRLALASNSYYLAFVVNIYIIYILSISVLKKEPIVYFYMAGFFFTSLIGLLLTFADFQLLRFPFENKDVFFLTPLVEILCVALGIGIHFSNTMRDRINVQIALNQTQDQIITIQEDERRRIAQDLHDDVGNSLAAVKNMVAQKKEAAEVEREIGNVIATIRTISHNLMPVDFNEFSLIDITAHLVNKYKNHPDVAVELQHSGTVIKLKPVTELVVYRIVNELITNIFKHAYATKAIVQLMYQKQSLVVTVEDNGVGIKNKPGVEEGIGLRSIRLRAAYLGASINVESDTKGTLVILEVPYERDGRN